MNLKSLVSLLLCFCLVLACGAALGEEITLSVGSQTFSASPDAVELPAAAAFPDPSGYVCHRYSGGPGSVPG